MHEKEKIFAVWKDHNWTQLNVKIQKWLFAKAKRIIEEAGESLWRKSLNPLIPFITIKNLGLVLALSLNI